MTQDWHLDAVCATTDPELWFPPKGDHHAREKARDICATCPVARQCLEYALANEERHGVWAGLTGEQLKKLGRKKKKAA